MGGLLFSPPYSIARETVFCSGISKPNRDIEIKSLIVKERPPVHVHALVAAPSSLVTIKWA